MTRRSAALDTFLGAILDAIGARVVAGTAAAAAIDRVRAAAGKPASFGVPPPPVTRPVVEHLALALDGAARGPADIGRVAAAVRAIAPELCWRISARAGTDPVFAAGHANATVLGPEADALERRDDVWIGLSLMAPGVTYPDHTHPPEEVYLALSPGAWRQEDRAWHEPGIGGLHYNPPGIVHAMRAGIEPFLAVWCLPLDREPERAGRP